MSMPSPKTVGRHTPDDNSDATIDDPVQSRRSSTIPAEDNDPAALNPLPVPVVIGPGGSRILHSTSEVFEVMIGELEKIIKESDEKKAAEEEKTRKAEEEKARQAEEERLAGLRRSSRQRVPTHKSQSGTQASSSRVTKRTQIILKNGKGKEAKGTEATTQAQGVSSVKSEQTGEQSVVVSHFPVNRKAKVRIIFLTHLAKTTQNNAITNENPA